MGYGPGDNSLSKMAEDIKFNESQTRTEHMAQIRELYLKLRNLQTTVENLQSTVDTSNTTLGDTTVPPMTNFVDNSDFVFSHYSYSFATDPTTNWILARWYCRSQSTTGAFNVNSSSTESATSIRSNQGNTGTAVGTFPYTDVNTTDNTITLNSHGLSNGTPVRLSTSGGLPTVSSVALSTSTDYFVVSATTNTFKLATTTGGTALDFDGQGTGNHSVTKYFPARTGVLWDTDTGGLATSGGYSLASPLASRYAFLGNTVYFKMQIIHKPQSITVTADSAVDTLTATAHGLANGTLVTISSTTSVPAPLTAGTVYYVVNTAANTFKVAETEGGTAIDLTDAGVGTLTVKTRIKKGLKCYIGIWDNTNNRIFRGDKPSLTLSKTGSHSGGTVTRQYILEVQMPDGRKFYSDLSDFTANQITNTVSASSVDADNYVAVRWTKVVGASRYNIYRRSGSDSWYLVATVPSSTNLLYDYGGNNSYEFTPPEAYTADQAEYQMAEAVVDDVTDAIYGTELAAFEVNANIQFPTIINNFDATGDQFLLIQFKKSDGSATDLADIPTNTLLLDKVCMSYVYGRWNPSSRDQSVSPDKTVPTSPVASGSTGDGTGESPTGGSGGTTGDIDYCVHENTPILLWSDTGKHFSLPAHSVVMGDRLVAWDGDKLVPSKVKAVTRGISRMNYRVYADNNELLCSFSHRLIANFDDFEVGTNVGQIDKTVLVYNNNNVKLAEVEGIESIEAPMRVITFKMQKGLENYISSNIMSHNAKRPMGGGEEGGGLF